MANVVIKMRRRTDLLAQFPEIFVQEISDAMTVAVSKVESEALPRSPIDLGFFRSSIAGSVASNPARIQVVGRIAASAQHAAIIEGVNEAGVNQPYGRRPGAAFPNVTALRSWVQRRLGVSGEKQVASVAYLVGRAIVRKGIKPTRPIGRAIEVSRDFIRRLFFEAGERIARRVEGK